MDCEAKDTSVEFQTLPRQSGNSVITIVVYGENLEFDQRELTVNLV